MADYDFDIGILGGGAAGLTIASGAARFGAKTLLIEKENVLGGDCLHFGCVPSKTLIRTANVYHLMKNAEKYGLLRLIQTCRLGSGKRIRPGQGDRV
jgi:pyruvate/2-oxoglutarate dehydrogenase complex dihydrolipoamide dehydrogenase (E3) component